MVKHYTRYNWEHVPAIQGNTEIDEGNIVPIEDTGRADITK